jgi:hypothetical protein
MGANGTKVIEVGEAALTGWRGTAARTVAKPIADRTRFSREQVEATIGFLLLAYALYRVLRPVIAAARRS